MLHSLEIPPEDLSSQCVLHTSDSFPANLQLYPKANTVLTPVRGMLISILNILRLHRPTKYILTGEFTKEHIKWLTDVSDMKVELIKPPKPDEDLNDYEGDLFIGTVPLTDTQINGINITTIYTISNTEGATLPQRSRKGGSVKSTKLATCYYIPYYSEVFQRVKDEDGTYTAPDSNTITNLINSRNQLQRSCDYSIRGRSEDVAALQVLDELYDNYRIKLDEISISKSKSLSTREQDVTQYSLIVDLGMACLYKDFDAIKRYLTHDKFAINDLLYRHQFCSQYNGDILLNDSAYLMRCAVASRSLAIVNLLFHETGPGSIIDPGAMNNIAIRDAIMNGRNDMVQLLASSPAYADIPKIYNGTVKYQLDNALLFYQDNFCNDSYTLSTFFAKE